MACYMAATGVAFVLMGSLEGPSNNVARRAARAADVGDAARRVDDVAETQVWNGSAWQPAEVPTDPIEQTDYLYQGDYLERELGIYFTADGRYYDPWLGKYLQPDPLGGPPLIPQAADRYQVAGNSPTGVGRAADCGSDFWTGLGRATGLSALSTGAGMLTSAYAQSHRYLCLTANWALLGRANYAGLFNQVFSPGRGRSALFFSNEAVTPISGRRAYRTVWSGQAIDLNVIEANVSQVHPVQWGVGYPQGGPLQSLDDTALKQWLRSRWGEFLSNWAIELVFAAPELIEPWQDPYFTTEQRLTQNAVTVGGTLVSAGVGTWVTGWLIAAGASNPVIFVAGVGTGVIVFVVWEYGVKPAVSQVAVWTGSRDPYQRYYNLRPLGGGQ
jgi:RHS repeat-associated protein